jgi:hypothetical protein
VIISCAWLQSCTRCSEFVDARGSILMNSFVWIFRFGLVKAFSDFLIVICRFPVLFVIRPFVIPLFVIPLCYSAFRYSPVYYWFGHSVILFR